LIHLPNEPAGILFLETNLSSSSTSIVSGQIGGKISVLFYPSRDGQNGTARIELALDNHYGYDMVFL